MLRFRIRENFWLLQKGSTKNKDCNCGVFNLLCDFTGQLAEGFHEKQGLQLVEFPDPVLIYKGQLAEGFHEKQGLQLM